MNNAVIIPSLEPDEKLFNLVDELFYVGFVCIIVIDDGSGENYKAIFNEIEKKGCKVVHHKKNMGKGEAIKTAIRFIKKDFPNINGFITADSDGQHSPKDILSISKALDENSEHIILGIRDFTLHTVPLRSKMGNAFSSLFFRINTGLKCIDTQTGLRGIPSSIADFALQIEGSRYDYEMNFLLDSVKSGIKLKMISIETIYENNNKKSHFKTISDSVRIYKTPLKFVLASLTCAIFDLTLFTVFSHIFNHELKIFISTLTARILSGVLNFVLNKKWSFVSNGDIKNQFFKYILLFVSQMLASSLFVSILEFLPISLTIIKGIVDSFLFIVSYFIQKNWVFKKDKNNKGNV